MHEQPASKRLVVIGSVNVDLCARVIRHPTPGETALGDGGERLPGGKGANQAPPACTQGVPVAFVAAVGSDPDAEVALASLHEAGGDLTGVSTIGVTAPVWRSSPSLTTGSSRVPTAQ